MSLLQKASIITTPTAYAEDYLYSIKPAYALGSELVTNGTFDTDSDWTKGDGWTISGGTANCDGSQSATTNFSQSAVISDLSKTYRVEFTLSNYAAGTIKSKISNSAQGVNRSANGTYVDFFSGMTNTALNFTASSDFIGSIDNVSVKEVTNADFDFDRNSTGTRVNEDYLIEDVPYNLVLHSQSFSSGWFNTNSTETLDTSVLAPDGTDTAWKLQANAGTHFSFLGQTVTMSGQISFSVFLKKGTSTTATLFLTEAGNFGLTANLENGTITSVTGSDMVGSVESAGNGWYRFEIKHTSGDDLSNSVRIGIEGGGFGSVTYDGTENIYIWGAQITKGDIKPYLKTTDRLDIPRIDYTNGEPSILLEPSRTNVVSNSEDFTTNWTTQGVTLTANQITSPDGHTKGGLIQSTGTSTALIEPSGLSLTIGVTYTYSVFVKKGNNRWIRLGHISSGSTGCWFDLDNGVLGTVNSTSATIDKYPNGWYRITNTFVATSTATNNSAFIGICDNNGSTNAGVIGQNVYIYGAQVEAGSYATSLIHTSGSSVTRSADVANNAGNSDLINSTEGVLYAEIKALVHDNSRKAIVMSDGVSQAKRVLISYEGNSSVNARAFVYTGTLQCDFSISVSSVLEYNKIALVYKANDFKVYVNGSLVGSDTSGSTFSANTLDRLSFSDGDGTSNFFGNAKMVAVFKEALSDEELACLTGYNNHELYMNYYNRLSYLGLVEEYNVESDINNYIL